MTEDALLSPTRVAQIFNVQTRTVRNWITAGKIQAIKTPTGRWRIRESEVIRLAQETYGGTQ